jgi:hypothetical protein
MAKKCVAISIDQSEPLSQSQQLETDVQQLLGMLVTNGIVARNNIMDISAVINPPEEVIEDPAGEPSIIEEAILAQFGLERDAETDEEVEILQKVTVNEALKALTTLQQFEEQAENCDEDFLDIFHNYEKRVRSRRFKDLKQQDITSFFSI